MEIEQSQCRVCWHSFAKTFHRREIYYGICSECGAVNKLLTEQQYWALGAGYDPGVLLDEPDKEVLRKHLGVTAKRAELQAVRKMLKTNVGSRHTVRLLEIGCGMGGYLLAGRDLGFEVIGVEPSESHSRIGREAFGLPIITAFFEKSNFAADHFDIVVLSHVIEHIFDPAQFLEDIAPLLELGGLIYIATPNAQSTIAKLSGAGWSMLVPVDHVTLMTPSALHMLAPKGFVTVLWTDEIIWEPAVVLIQAIRNTLKLAISQILPSYSEHRASSNNSFRSTITKVNGNLVAGVLFSAISLPMWLWDRVFDQAHCIFLVYQKSEDARTDLPFAGSDGVELAP